MLTQNLKTKQTKLGPKAADLCMSKNKAGRRAAIFLVTITIPIDKKSPKTTITKDYTVHWMLLYWGKAAFTMSTISEPKSRIPGAWNFWRTLTFVNATLFPLNMILYKPSLPSGVWESLGSLRRGAQNAHYQKKY